MVGHKIDDDFESRFVGTLDKVFKLRHAVLYLHCHVRAHVIVVTDGIGRPRFSLHHMGIAGSDALAGVIGGSGMLDDAGVPHVSGTQRFDGTQFALVNFVELSHTILADTAIGYAMFVAVGEPSWHQLVDNHLFLHIHVAKVGIFLKRRKILRFPNI